MASVHVYHLTSFKGKYPKSEVGLILIANNGATVYAIDLVR